MLRAQISAAKAAVALAALSFTESRLMKRAGASVLASRKARLRIDFTSRLIGGDAELDIIKSKQGRKSYLPEKRFKCCGL